MAVGKSNAGYESLENYLYLDSTGQTCFIKPTNYDQRRSKKFRKQIGRVENMEYNAEEDYFTCVQGRRLSLRQECTELQNGQKVAINSARFSENIPVIRFRIVGKLVISTGIS